MRDGEFSKRVAPLFEAFRTLELVKHLKKRIHTNPRFSVVFESFADARLNDTELFYLDKASGVSVVACTGESILMLESFRPLAKQIGLELPGGRIEVGETAACAAKREFCEETGHAISRLIQLDTIQPYPNISNEQLHIFKGSVEHRHAGEAADQTEGIVGIHFVQHSQLASVISAGRLHFSADVHALCLAFSPSFQKSSVPR